MREEEKSIQELLLLQRIAQRINSILELETLLEEVVNDIVETFGYSRSGVLLKDNETNELVIAAVRGWTVNYHMKGERFKIGEYGIIGHVGMTEETYYAPDVKLDPYYKVSEHSTNSELDIPLKAQGRLIGVFNFQHQDVNAFPPARIQLLEALSGHVATAIVNARLFENERRDNDRMSRELAEARSVQSSQFPERSPHLQDFEITGLCIPCREVGGDWFDYIPLPDGNLAVVLADVSGKGPGAAMLMSSCRSILRMFAEKSLSPSEVLTNVNRILVKDFPKTRFVTMIYGVIIPGERKIILANAGHPAPILASTDKVHQITFNSGLPLGILDEVYNEYTLSLPAGTRLLFYSDGINEAMNTAEEMYGEERLLRLLKDPGITIPLILNDVQDFIKNCPAYDDMTLVLIKSKFLS